MKIEPMPAITIWQPYASLIGCGAKRFETRSWATTYRGPIAIHAAAKKPSSIWELIEGIIDQVRAALGIIDPDDLPRGCIIATAELVGCHQIWTSAFPEWTPAIPDSDEPGTACEVLCAGSNRISKRSNEYLFGDWTPGRYAWELRNVQLLDTPIPAKGKQGLWRWEGVA